MQAHCNAIVRNDESVATEYKVGRGSSANGNASETPRTFLLGNSSSIGSS